MVAVDCRATWAILTASLVTPTHALAALKKLHGLLSEGDGVELLSRRRMA